MSESSKAVFLSYASQDAEAARRIADALRSAGVEVWFDQSELRGGDAWDAAIRKQIKECTLFVPVISANTQSRAEGYFRLEWRLAVDRSHLMADDAPFLFPIVIGDVSDAAARVPDKFREVQWTRLKLEETATEIATRVAKLLSSDVGAPLDGARGRAQGAPLQRNDKRGFEKWWWLIFPIMGMSVPIIGVLKRDGSRPERPPPAVTQPAQSEARRLAERARDMSLEEYNSTASDFATAEGLIARALEMDPNDAEIWAIASLFHTSIRTRGFDHASGRRAQARAAAERALKLAPDSVNALFSMVRALRDSDPAAAEANCRRILELDPNHADAMSQLAWLCDLSGRFDEAVALYDRVLVLDPQEAPLTHYVRYLLFLHYGRFAEAEAAAAQSVALQPASNSVTAQAIVALTWRGDADAAARALAAAPAEIRGETRMIWIGALVHLARRDPAETLRTLQLTEADYIQDNWFAGPKAMFAGLAHRQAGRHEAARVAWQSALAQVDERLKTAPASRDLHLARGQLLAWLDRTEEARREVRTLEEMRPDQPERTWIYSPVLIHAATGDAAAAAPLLERLLDWDRSKNNGWPLTAALLRIEPRFDKLRGDKRIQKLIADAEARQIAAMPPRDWPKDPELKRVIEIINGYEAIDEDYALAEEMARAVVEKKPFDPEAATVLARVHSQFLLRGFDRSDERYAQGRRQAERALALAPDEPEALYSLAVCIFSRRVEFDRVEQLLRRASELAPAESSYARYLAFVLMERDEAGGLRLAEEVAAKFPGDALAQYDLARRYGVAGMAEEMEAALDRAIAIYPLTTAIISKARVRLWTRGDLNGMKEWIDRVPDRQRSTERVVVSRFLLAIVSGEARDGLEALDGLSVAWIEDFDYTGPRDLLKGDLQMLQGRPELARLSFESALAEVERQKARAPASIAPRSAEVWLLHRLGRTADARARVGAVIDALDRPFRIGLYSSWMFRPIPMLLMIGERDKALELLREASRWPESRQIVRTALKFDPNMVPWRDDAEILALVAEPEKKN